MKQSLRREVLIILLIKITEVLGFSLVLPFLPYFAEDLGATPIQIGLILTTFSFFQFFTAPIMGRLSDVYGRRPLLLLSQLATVTSFVILGIAKTIPLIFLSRTVDGLLGSNFTIAQAYLSDISTKKDRSQVFGIGGIAFGLGFMIGPAIGGSLTRFGYAVPAFAAAGLSLLSMILTYLYLPETVKKNTARKLKVKIIDPSVFGRFWRRAETGRRLAHFSAYVGAQAIFTSNFSLFARRRLNIDPATTGYLLALIGLMVVITRGPLIKRLIKTFGEERLLIIGMVMFEIGLLISAVVDRIWLMGVVLMMFAVGNGLSRPLITGAISRSVPASEQGAVMGVTNSLASLTNIVAPLLGGVILTYFWPGWLALASAACMGIGFLLIKEKKHA